MSSIYFWKSNETPFGIFSQWYHSPFQDIDGVSYENVEQYMSYKKALLFGDRCAAVAILTTLDPWKAKHLGRKVKKFSMPVWCDNRRRIAYEGNMYKFKSSIGLKKILLDTNDRELVQASPFDKIWGIGYKEDDAEHHRSTWGENLLGKILMDVRKSLLEQDEIAK